MATIKQNVPKINFEMRRGDTFNPTFHVTDSSGNTIDYSLHTARMDIKDEIDGTIILSLTSPTDIILSNTNPNISILIDDSVVAGFTFSDAVHDLELVSPSGVVKTHFEGSIVLKLDVTV